MEMDAFALLGQPRQPILNLDSLRESQQRFCQEFHPDLQKDAEGKAQAQAALADVNQAFRLLSDPAARLRHLIELEYGMVGAKIEQIPSQYAESLFEMAGTLRTVETVLERAMKASSTIEKALFYPELLQAKQSVESIAQQLAEKRAGVLQPLQTEDWRNLGLPALSDAASLLGYFQKAEEQVNRLQTGVREALLS